MKVFRLKHLETQKVSFSNLDSIAEVHHLTLSKNELINRLEANRCEYCGKETPTCQVHHVRKLSNLKKKPKPWLWEKIMIARNRKTLILCAGTKESCHELLHAGKLPDNRYFAT
jgi:hypothetical protein